MEQDTQVQENISLLTDYDIHLFKEGRHYKLYEKLGAHVTEHEGQKGVFFALWAPNAEYVSVIGDFNGWNKGEHALRARQDESGIWEGFIPQASHGNKYKYFIRSRFGGKELEKADPFAFHSEIPPQTASVVWDTSEMHWEDQEWLKSRKEPDFNDTPYSVYEMHLGSWRRDPSDPERFLSYRELAHELPGYLKETGFTHVEFLPVMQHPFYGSWGYQVTGYYAPDSRFGTPQDFMYLVNELHKNNIGVILDWVPSHFPSDPHGLATFDGTHLYEHEDPRKGFHPDWKSWIFNVGRNEVKNFLISSALFWLERYHADGLRVDAVASMLYLDYSREEGEWIPNEFGGRENLENIQFLKEFNDAVHDEFPNVPTIAEESTAWPMVSRPTQVGGLGFNMKWMMGWMHDTLNYLQTEPVYRTYHQGQLTFSIVYAFTENYMLPLSHDEVVHGKGSIVDKMPGDEWQKFANTRTLYSFMFAHPGAKLLFMGSEFGQLREWNHDRSLDWHLLNGPNLNNGLKNLVSRLNYLYRHEKPLHQNQFVNEGFEWVDLHDAENSVISFLRKAKDGEKILIVCNFTPVVRENYRVGVPEKGEWVEIFNSDDQFFGGSGVLNREILETFPVPIHNRSHSVNLTLPPLGVSYIKLAK